MSIRPTTLLRDPSPATVVVTLYPASLEDSVASDNLGSSAATPAAAAELHDASDATYSKVVAAGDGLDAVVLEWREEWVMDQASGMGNISNVRVIVTHKRLANSTGTIQASMVGIASGSAIDVELAATESTWDFPLHPMDSTPWTNAKVNAHTWGWFVAAEGDDANATVEVRVEEMRLEVTYS